MCEDYNSILPTPTEADTDISAKPKYRPGPYIGLSLLNHFAERSQTQTYNFVRELH